MKAKFTYRFLAILTMTFTVFSFTNGIAQEKSKKQLKEERQLEKQKQISQLVNSKEFVFEPKTVFSQTGRAIQLTTEYSVEFHPEIIKSYLPFFGRGYSGIGYGGDNGMTFEGKPENFSIEKVKKNYVIQLEVKGEKDTYTLMLSVYFDGGASLSINSNNRSPISYTGSIKEFKKK